jgi:hypothetical protein
VTTTLHAVVVGRERALPRGTCGACGRDVALTRARRCRVHVTPDGALHVDEPAVGVTPIGPRRRTTCTWCSGPLAAAQIAKAEDHCSKACAFEHRLAADPDLPKRASAKGQVTRRRQYAARLSAQLAPHVRRILDLAARDALTPEAVLRVLADQHRRSYKAGHTVGAVGRRRAAPRVAA